MMCKHLPGYGFAGKEVAERVASCPLCQKFRLGSGTPVQPIILYMKVRKRRTAIGADILKITPPDKYGNIGLLVIVNMATKLVALYTLQDESSHSVAVRFILHYVTYGLYDIISVDPGSNISFGVTEELHRVLGMLAKVSLVDRHESNGAEGTNQQFIRHLIMLVQSERSKDRWGEPEFVACVQYVLNSHINQESSDQHSPFELTFGSEAAPYYMSINEKIISMEVNRRSEFLAKLNADLDMLWSLARQHQEKIISDTQEDKQNKYQQGDLALHKEN